MLTERIATPLPSKSGNELAEGLMLVRASTLKMLRLQLAMERRDRRSAIEAVDELLEIDRSLSQCLPLADLDDERAALHREKLMLAAEVITRDPWVEPVAATPLSEPEPAVIDADPWLTEAWDDELAAPARRRIWPWLVAMALVAALVAAAFFIGLPAEIARLEPLVAGLR